MSWLIAAITPLLLLLLLLQFLLPTILSDSQASDAVNGLLDASDYRLGLQRRIVHRMMAFLHCCRCAGVRVW